MTNHLIQYQNKSHLQKLLQVHNFKINKNKPTFIFIEPYGASLSLIKRGFENQFNIIIITAHEDLRIVPLPVLNQSNLCIQTDTHNAPLLIDIAKVVNQFCPIQGVIPGFEYFVPVALKVAYELNLPVTHPKLIQNIRKKNSMREILQKHHLRQPNFFYLNDINQINEAIQKIGFPAVCKPIDAAGSVHVRKVKNKAELIAAAMRILQNKDVLWGYSLSKSLLIEEYIDGKEFSVEGVICQGLITFFSITEKFVSDENDFIEIGHIVNFPVPIQIQFEIEKYLKNVITVLGVNYCPFHAELRLDKNNQPILMEIAARLPGDKIGDLINLSSSVNYFDAVFVAYSGKNLSSEKNDRQLAGIRFFYRPDIDCFNTIRGADNLNHFHYTELQFYYQPHEIIPNFPKPLRRLGHVIAKDHSYLDLKNLLLEIDNKIGFDPCKIPM